MGRFLVGASVLCVVLILSGVDRGFDISDEGLYLLLADPLQENVAGIFNYDLFFKLFFRFTGYSFSLIELRIVRLICYLAGAWALAAFWKNIELEVKVSLRIYLVSVMTLMGGYAFLPPTLSYNALAVVLVCFWFYFVSLPRLSRTDTFLLGVIFGVLVYVKVSLALVVFPLTLLILMRKVSLVSIFLMLLPFVILELVFFGALGENATTRLLLGIPQTALRPGYQFGMMFKSIAVGALWTVVTAALFALIGFLRRTQSRVFVPLLISVILLSFWVCYVTHITDEWNHLVLLAFAAVFGFCLGLAGRIPVKTKVWIVLLIAFPYLMHFGSNVYWLRIGIHYWVFWVLAFLLCFEQLKTRVFISTAVFSLVLVFNGVWWHPFGQDSPLWEVKQAWKRPLSGAEIWLDPALVDIILKIERSEAARDSKQLTAAYRIPGIVWLAGKQTPFSPVIWDRVQLEVFFEMKPDRMIYNKFDNLPQNWRYKRHQHLGAYQGDSLRLLWD